VSETVFTKIIRGEIPCHRVWEDDRVFAFLDIAPLAPGHVLVVPKEPAATLDALSEESAAALGRVLPRIARAVMAATGTRDFNVLQNNGAAAHQAVPHVHFHVIPKPAASGGLGIDWPSGRLEADEGRRIAAEISARLANG
jgi:histidine triad (HIT) family protein